MRRTFRINLIALVPLVVALLTAAAPARAQSTGTLQGTVADTQGAVMPGVSIVIRNQGTGLERTATTDSAGQYVAASLQPGRYQIAAHIEGFQDQTREVILDVAQTV